MLEKFLHLVPHIAVFLDSGCLARAVRGKTLPNISDTLTDDDLLLAERVGAADSFHELLQEDTSLRLSVTKGKSRLDLKC